MEARNSCLVFVLVLCFLQNSWTRTFDLDNEEVETAKSQISEFLGNQQLVLRSYLSRIKLERQTIDHDVNQAIQISEQTFDNEIKQSLKELDPDAKTGLQAEQQNCIDALEKETKDLKKEIDTVRPRCGVNSKPSIRELDEETTKYAGYQMKIGQLPQTCVKTNEDTNAILTCVKKLVEEVKVEMKEVGTVIDGKLKEVQQKVKTVEEVLDACRVKEIEELKNKIIVITEHFNTCVEK